MLPHLGSWHTKHLNYRFVKLYYRNILNCNNNNLYYLSTIVRRTKTKLEDKGNFKQFCAYPFTVKNKIKYSYGIVTG